MVPGHRGRRDEKRNSKALEMYYIVMKTAKNAGYGGFATDASSEMTDLVLDYSFESL